MNADLIRGTGEVMAMRGSAVALGAAGVAVLLCWNMIAPAEVTRDQVESGTLAELAATPADDLDCGGGLRAEVGASQTCTLTRGGEQFAVDLKVTGVHGADVSWDSTVAAEPRTGRRVSEAELESRAREAFARQHPGVVVTCEGALPGAVGATRRCAVTSGGTTRHVVATVNSVGDARILWSVAAAT